jgi:GntR family transcriptional regulator
VVAATAINPNTVLRAYRDLEQAGLVELRRGLGTFVTRSLVRPGTEDDSPLRREVTDWVARARAGGLERADVLAMVTAVLDAYGNEHDSHTRATGNGRRRTHDQA